MSEFLKNYLPEFDDNAQVGMSEQDQTFYETVGLGDEHYKLGPESIAQSGVPQGVITQHQWKSTHIYPGTERDYWVYVPKQYDSSQPACLMVFQDGGMYLDSEVNVPAVLDNLIHKGDIPIIIAVFVNPGNKGPGLPIYGGTDNRSIEYDSLGNLYARFLIEELIPEIEKDYVITSNPEGRAICGISSGGICAFTVAWERPDIFRKVISHCGSFTNIRGGHNYPSIVRRRMSTKPLRIFLQTGENDLNIVFGNWTIANQAMSSALKYKGYDHQFIIGKGGHTLKHGASILPDTMRWLWRDHS